MNEMILWLLEKNPAHRPTAAEALDTLAASPERVS